MGLQGVGVNAHVDNELPEFIADIVGKTFIFQLKLVEFNFTPKHQTFTISRIISERQDAPLPEFVINIGTSYCLNIFFLKNIFMSITAF